MRIKINLTSADDVPIPIEYNYNIYLNTRKTLFSFLQDQKPKLANKYKREFPQFTFSQLMIPERVVETGFIRIMGNFLSLMISSADDVFIEYLVKAVNRQKSFSIYNHTFPLKKVEVLDEPEFTSPMHFKMLSPLLLFKEEDGGTVFLRPWESDVNKVFAAHLVENYNNSPYAETTGQFRTGDIKLELDQEYAARKKNLTKLFTIRSVHYKTIFSPFSLKGEEELIRFAYHNGIGFKTNFGFGMIETGRYNR